MTAKCATVSIVPSRTVMQIGTSHIDVADEGGWRQEFVKLNVYHDSPLSKIATLVRSVDDSATLYLTTNQRRVEGENDPYLGFGNDYTTDVDTAEWDDWDEY